MTVSTTHKLLTNSWNGDVASFESAIGRLTARRPLANECEVAFFEIAGDADLHVNVTHRRPTRAVRGWSGPGRLPNGYVHNRRFGGAEPSLILRRIREMVYAGTP